MNRQSRRGRPKSTLGEEEAVALIISAIDASAASGETAATLLTIRLRPILAKIKLEAYARVARLTLGSIGIRPERFDTLLIALELPPLNWNRCVRAKKVRAVPVKRPDNRPRCADCQAVALLDAGGRCVNRGRCVRRVGRLQVRAL